MLRRTPSPYWWQRFYNKYFPESFADLDYGFWRTLKIPPAPKGKGSWWLVVVPAGIRPNDIRRVLERLDVTVVAQRKNLNFFQNADNVTQSQVLWVPHYPDSALVPSRYIIRDRMNESLPAINLPARLIYELAYYVRTGRHLDLESLTLCTSSRLAMGKKVIVPAVDYGLIDFQSRQFGVRITEWSLEEIAEDERQGAELFARRVFGRR